MSYNNRFITNRYKELTELQKLSILINKEVQHPYYSNHHSKHSILIVCNSHYIFKLQMLIAMKTRLRFTDLIQFDLSGSAKNKTFNIIQHKTSKIISQKFYLFNVELFKRFLLPGSNNIIWNYNSLAGEIRKIKMRHLSHLQLNFKSELHIFRHLDATFYKTKNFSSDSISKILGNTKKTVDDYYIHSFN